MAKQFQSEKEGQLYFFERLGIKEGIEFSSNNDGVYRGTLFEFKLNIPNINSTLFQAIKYLSSMRVRGKEIPKNILLVALNSDIAYNFNSEDFLEDIEKVYSGSASKNNNKFIPEIKYQHQKIEYNKSDELQKLLEIINSNNYTKINIDLFCVVGWAERFYRDNPNSTKLEMFDELRNPKLFKDFIYPWFGEENDFKYIMDCLNDRMHKKELGAFYTPPAYCKKATELVRKAIAQVPNGNDYIILDRCAGTGNLQEFLTDKNVDDITVDELNKYLPMELKREYLYDKNDIIYAICKKYPNRNSKLITLKELEEYKTNMSIYDYLFDNELSHCIVNTFELKEWIVLNKRIGDKVRMIIPPYQDVIDTAPLVRGGDALSANFILGERSNGLYNISNEYYDSIKKLNGYVNNPNTNVIMFENPPYSEVAGGTDRKETKKNLFKNSFVCQEMKKEIKGFPSNDITNLFIWSALKYYLNKKEDSYILFSPVKYFKSQEIMNKTFKEGFIFNRKYFHATVSSISCIWWQNENNQQDKFPLLAIDMKDNLITKYNLDINTSFDEHRYKYKSVFNKNDSLTEEDEFLLIYGLLTKDNLLLPTKNIVVKKVKNTQQSVMKTGHEGFAILVSQGFAPDFKHGFLRNDIEKVKNWHSSFIWLNTNNYLKYLPFWVSNCYVGKTFADKDIYFKTADGGDKYIKDADFLKECFIFACLSQRNHCLSFFDDNGKFYKNELCFDSNTIATNKLKELSLTDKEKNLIDTFKDILDECKKIENYNPAFSYGTYQIDKELNTRYKDANTKTTIYNYPELNTKIIALKTKLATFYEEVIQPKLFHYELLK